MRVEKRILDLSVRELLEHASAEAPTPGAGSVAALTAALAASLTEMAARASGRWGEAAASCAQAAVLRERLEELAPANDEAYEHALAALNLPTELDASTRNQLIGASLERAAAVPLAITEAASDVADLAAYVAQEGDPRVRPDAAAAALLALGAARAAAHLVEINLGVRERDERLLQAQRLAADAAAAAARSLAPT
jgi:formiminotetrahydrofolate cyclodeaminase